VPPAAQAKEMGAEIEKIYGFILQQNATFGGGSYKIVK